MGRLFSIPIIHMQQRRWARPCQMITLFLSYSNRQFNIDFTNWAHPFERAVETSLLYWAISQFEGVLFVHLYGCPRVRGLRRPCPRPGLRAFGLALMCTSDFDHPLPDRKFGGEKGGGCHSRGIQGCGILRSELTVGRKLQLQEGSQAPSLVSQETQALSLEGRVASSLSERVASSLPKGSQAFFLKGKSLRPKGRERVTCERVASSLPWERELATPLRGESLCRKRHKLSCVSFIVSLATPLSLKKESLRPLCYWSLWRWEAAVSGTFRGCGRLRSASERPEAAVGWGQPERPVQRLRLPLWLTSAERPEKESITH